MIKIVSGSSIPVGSTVALVNLCNQFNRRGYDCILYGPDRWHLDKCTAGTIADFSPEDGDVIIVHHIRLFSFRELYTLGEKIRRKNSAGWSSLKGLVLSNLPRSQGHAGITLILTCQGNCEQFQPYSFNYPAAWKANWDPSTEIITGWIDGFGDFKMDTSIIIEAETFRDVPYLDVWP